MPGLPRLGTTKPLREIMDGKTDDREPKRLMDQVAAWQVANVLIGTPPPENGVGGRIAFKTGTSYGYRDAWSVGFDGHMTIGVWVGRPDGAPVPGLIGRAAAAPILFDAFARTGKQPVPLPKAPKGALMASNARLPLPLAGSAPMGELVRTGSEQALHIQFPLNGSRIDVDRSGGAEVTPMPVRVAGGALPMTVHGQRPFGRRDRRPQATPDRSAGSGLCAADRDRRCGRGGHSCRAEFSSCCLKRLSDDGFGVCGTMVETYARPRFGAPREPKNLVNPGSRLAQMIDFVTASHARAVAFLLLCARCCSCPDFSIFRPSIATRRASHRPPSRWSKAAISSTSDFRMTSATRSRSGFTMDNDR